MNGDRAWSDRRLHFIGIGGCGMSGLALVAQARGAQVSGSDRAEGPYLDRLRRSGIDVAIGHAAAHVPEGEQVELVVSSAIPPDNVERVAGRRRQLREHHRVDLLVELARARRCVAVAGTHGKTTTAAMIVHAMRGAGEAVNYVIGGDILSTGVNAEWSDSDWVVLETDESDRSILSLTPDVGLVTNVEWDHVETFDSLAAVEDVFVQFLEHSSVAVVADAVGLRSACHDSWRTVEVPSCTLNPRGSHFAWRGHEVDLSVVGRHNVLNAVAALEAVFATGADAALAAKAMVDFQGVARRFERLGRTREGAVLFDDYAHHPTEVAVTLAGARTLGHQRLIAVLRPWGLARTQKMAGAYGKALGLADVAVVLDVAGGAPGSSAEAARIVDAALDAAPDRLIRQIGNPDAAADFVRAELGPGTIVVTLGCRDVADRLMSAVEVTATGDGGA